MQVAEKLKVKMWLNIPSTPRVYVYGRGLFVKLQFAKVSILRWEGKKKQREMGEP